MQQKYYKTIMQQKEDLIYNIMFNGPNTVTDGLVFYLDAANIKSYQSGSLIWNNLTRGTNSCSFNSSKPTYSSGNGGELVFDATPIYTSMGPGTNYPYPYHTYEMWVKTSGLGPGMTLAGLFGMDYGRVIYINSNSSIQYALYSGSVSILNVNGLPPNTNLFDNTYHQVVCLRNTSSYEIYVDSTLIKTGGNGGNPTWDGLNVWSTMPSQIANNPNDGVYRLSGSIAIAKIYNRGLTQAEVTQNYNATKGRLGR